MILDEAGLARQAALGEDSRHRFLGVELEERELACEMAALANSAGGEIFLGLAEDGSMPGLAGAMIARVNKTLQRAAQCLVPPLVVRTGNILLASGRVVIVVEVPVSRKLVLDDAGKAWVKVAAGRVAQAPDEACGHFQSFQSDGKASDKAGRESLVETREPSCDSDPEQDGRLEEKNPVLSGLLASTGTAAIAHAGKACRAFCDSRRRTYSAVSAMPTGCVSMAHPPFVYEGE